jgi:hypothetical protein
MKHGTPTHPGYHLPTEAHAELQALRDHLHLLAQLSIPETEHPRPHPAPHRPGPLLHPPGRHRRPHCRGCHRLTKAHDHRGALTNAAHTGSLPRPV